MVKDHFHEENKENFPGCLAFIFAQAGYTTLISLKRITQESILEVERFVDENKATLSMPNGTCRAKCGCKSYSTVTEFKFLPGHRIMINILIEMLGRRSEAIEQQLKGAKGPNQSNQCKKYWRKHSKEKLSQMLIQSIHTVCKKENYPKMINLIKDVNVTEYLETLEPSSQCGKDHFSCKLTFGCPVCPHRSRLTFKEYWMTSNASKHLRIHIEAQKKADAEKLAAQQAASSAAAFQTGK